MLRGLTLEAPGWFQKASLVATTNEQLVKVDSITSNVAQVSTNVSALTSLFAATLGSPVVKVAVFSYGVRRAMSGRGAKSGSRRGRR